MTSDETCSGVGQCQKDAAIRDARRETLRGMGVQVVGNGEWSGARETASQRLGFEGIKTTRDGGIRAGGNAQSRTFTRDEVLTVLRARRAMMDTTASSDAARYNELADLIRIFERME